MTLEIACEDFLIIPRMVSMHLRKLLLCVNDVWSNMLLYVDERECSETDAVLIVLHLCNFAAGVSTSSDSMVSI